MTTRMWTLFFLFAFSLLGLAHALFEVNVENSWEVSEETAKLAIPLKKLGGQAKPANTTDPEYKKLGPLYTKGIRSKIEQYTWPPESLEGILEEIPLRERPAWEEGQVFKILLVYPSTKNDKNEPLERWITPQIREVLEKRGMKFEYASSAATFKVNDTGVGEQPFDQMGPLGAWNRTRYCADHLEDKPAKDHNSIPDAYRKYHAIVILSLESSITSKQRGAYDSPNIIIYEVYSGYTLAVRGAGPGVQKNILDHTLDTYGYDEECPVAGLCGKLTYGMDLYKIYSASDSNWHEPVCGVSRKRLIGDVLNPKEFKFDVVQAFGLEC